MQIREILSPARIVCKAKVSSKKRALELLSQLLAEGQALGQQDVFDSLVTRERLGSTALSHGVALPHGRMKTAQLTLGAFVVLEQGVDFDALDRQPVDLLFALVVPEHCTEEHLQLLGQLAEMFNREEFRAQLRAAQHEDELLRLFTDAPSAS